MALLFTEGFGKYGPEGQSFSSVQNVFNTGYVLSGGGSAILVQGFSNDTMALQLSRTSSAAPRLSRSVTSTSDVVIVGFEMSANTRFNGFFSIQDVVSIDWPSFMSIEGNNGTAIPILNTSYYVEIKITKSTKAYEMKLNGYSYLSGILTAPSVPDTMVLQWGFPTTGASAAFRFSNITFVDGTPGTYTDFIGPQSIREDRPSTSVTPITWDPVPSNKTNVQIMNNNPPLVSEYTNSDVVGESDYYTSSTPVSGTVTAVAITTLIGKTDIDSQSVKIGIGAAGSRKEGPVVDVEVQPRYVQQVFETDAADASWTAGSASTVPFGVTIQPRD